MPREQEFWRAERFLARAMKAEAEVARLRNPTDEDVERVAEALYFRDVPERLRGGEVPEATKDLARAALSAYLDR